jgi:hypothetical protein
MYSQVQDTPSGVERSTDPQLALREANGTAEGKDLFSGHVRSGVSAAQDAPADLEDAYNTFSTSQDIQ